MVEITISLEDLFLQSSVQGWGVTEYIKRFSYTFSGGKTYGIVGELGDGAWSVACLLSGSISLHTKMSPAGENFITINGNPANSKSLEKISCFLKLGVVEEKKKLLLGEKTARQQIIRGLSRSNVNSSLQEIVELFHLSPERLDRPLSHYSGEGWRASLAIGFAYGKKVFVCPWLKPSNLQYIGIPQFQSLFDFVKKSGAIVVMPTNKTGWVKPFADELIYIENPWADLLPPELTT